MLLLSGRVLAQTDAPSIDLQYRAITTIADAADDFPEPLVSHEDQEEEIQTGLPIWLLVAARIHSTYPKPHDALRGFLKYGDDHPDIIEQFTLTGPELGNRGSLTAEGPGITYSDDGVQIGSTPVNTAGPNRLYWDRAFVSINNLVAGFTLQFEVEKECFAEFIVDQSEDRLLMSLGGTNPFFIQRNVSRNNWRLHSVNDLSGVKTYDDAYRDHVIVTVSFNPLVGAFGHVDFYADYFLIGSWDLNAAPDFDSNLYLAGMGTAGAPNLTQRIKNVMLIQGATQLTNSRERVIVSTGDSWGVFGQYQSGIDSNNYPPITGYMLDGYGDASQNARTDAKNRSYLSALHYELINKNIYPKGNRINFFSRSGARVLPTGGKPLAARVDAVLGENTSRRAPHFPAELGNNVAQIWLINVGLNDAGWFADGENNRESRTLPDYIKDLISEYKVQLDRIIDDGAELVVINGVAPRFLPASEPVTEQYAATTQAINAAYLAELDGYRGVTRYTDVYTDYIPGYSRKDGLHPNKTGQVYLAKKTAAVIQGY